MILRGEDALEVGLLLTRLEFHHEPVDADQHHERNGSIGDQLSNRPQGVAQAAMPSRFLLPNLRCPELVGHLIF